MSAQRTIVVAYPALSAAVDAQAFNRAFPEFEVLHVPYEIPHQLQTERVRDPQGSLALEPILNPEQAAAFARAEILVTLDAPRDLSAIAPKLRWIQTVGSGIAQYGVSNLGEGGITLTNAAGIGAGAIAEWVLGRIISILKRFDVHAAQQRAHHWQPVYGELLTRKTVAVIGLGAIGCEVAWRCAALGMNVIGVRRTPCAPGEEPKGVSAVYAPEHLHAVAAKAKVVVAAVPQSPETEDAFNAAFFAAMPQGAVFMNVGRGTSVDEDALVAALRSGHLHAAALDVTRQEPLPAESPLWDVPNLHHSPHSSPSPEGYMDRLWALFLDNLEAYRNGRPLRNTVAAPVTLPPKPAAR
jgi:phosphoglycerate dehydrogenase-like enzyme